MDHCPLVDLLCQSRWWDVVFLRLGPLVNCISSPWNKLHRSPTCYHKLKSPSHLPSGSAFEVRGVQTCGPFLSMVTWKNQHCGYLEIPLHTLGFSPGLALATTGPRPRIQLCADRECSLILSPFKFEVQFIGMGAIWLTLVVL